MRLFIEKILLFLTFPVILFNIIFIFMSLSSYKMIENEFKDRKIYYIIAGDSHIRQTFDDRKIKYTKNVAQNSESYYFTYYKLKSILEKNTQIKTVFLGLSYHNLSGYIDDFIIGKFSGSVSKNYFFLVPFNEKMNLIIANKNEPVNYFKSVLFANLKNLITEEKSFIGGYNNTFNNSKANIKSIEKRINSQYYKNKSDLYKPSKLNILYLNKIKELCQINKVKLIFLNPPVDKNYKDKIPSFYLRYFDILKESGDFEYLEFENLGLNENCFIPDGDHVSVKGAEICTKALTDYLNKM